MWVILSDSCTFFAFTLSRRRFSTFSALHSFSKASPREFLSPAFQASIMLIAPLTSSKIPSSSSFTLSPRLAGGEDNFMRRAAQQKNVILYLSYTRKGNLIGEIREGKREKRIVCLRMREKARTGATKFACMQIIDEEEGRMKRIGTIVLGEAFGSVRVRRMHGILKGRAYIGSKRIDLAEFTSKNGKKFLRSISD